MLICIRQGIQSNEKLCFGVLLRLFLFLFCPLLLDVGAWLVFLSSSFAFSLGGRGGGGWWWWLGFAFFRLGRRRDGG